MKIQHFKCKICHREGLNSGIVVKCLTNAKHYLQSCSQYEANQGTQYFFFLFCCFVFGGGKKNIANSQETEFNHGSWLLLQPILFWLWLWLINLRQKCEKENFHISCILKVIFYVKTKGLFWKLERAITLLSLYNLSCREYQNLTKIHQLGGIICHCHV